MSTATISLTINGQTVAVSEGTTVLEAARLARINLPTLCHHPDLEPYGGCRLCVVEIEGQRGLPTACTTRAAAGMVVRTNTARLRRARRTVMTLLLADHPRDCLICEANQRCELQEMAQTLGIRRQPYPPTNRISPVDDSNPFFVLDRSRCILCARCTRTCREVTGINAIELAGRGDTTRVATAGDGPLLDSVCRSCGECVAHCPTGALAVKENPPPQREVLTTCPYCGVGCQIYLGVRENRIVSVRGQKENSPNNGWLCVKGRFGVAEVVHHPERLTTPLIRRDGELKEATWDEALDLIARRLKSYRADELAVLASAKCSNEDNYVIQKLGRAVLGTNNIDHCARLCHAPSVSGLAQSFGSGAMTNSIAEIADAALIFVIGANTTATHPVIGYLIRQAVRRGRAKLIVANPREIDLCKEASLWLRLRPGSDVALLMGMMRVIVDEKLTDDAFIRERCENYEAFRVSLARFDAATVTALTGVDRETLVAAARLYATAKPATLLYAMGITQSSHGTDNVIATANLAMLTGNVGKPSSGVNPLRGQNNVQGACDMGALPNVFPGYQAVADPAARQRFEAAWGVNLPAEPGITLTEILTAAYRRQIKALYVVGENPLLSEPCAGHAREALEELDFLVVQDIFLSDTARLAHVVLPAASFAEKDGTFTNTERRVQRLRPAVPSPGSAQPDWWIISQLAQKMGGKGFDYKDAEAIFDEIRRLVPSYAGISYRRLEAGGLMWPCPAENHPGTPCLHKDTFTRGKGRFLPLEYRPPGEMPDADYPLVLTTERSLFHYHTGTMTRRVAGLNVLHPEELIEIHPRDAAALGITDGERVRVTSRRGEVTARCKVSPVTPPGVVTMSFHFAESPTNVLTSPILDPVAKIPELKVCAVRVAGCTDG